MSILVLSEKPSVARDIARILGASKRGRGYLEGNGYVVTWALGHLVHFAEPDDYGPSWKGRWSFGQLPMIPEQWKLKTTGSTADQFQIVKKLLNDSETKEVVCATDAGREGENIFRLIYEHARCKKPFKRLWISSLTDEAIRGGFGALQEGAAFDPLADAARARGQADWLMGMNLTRAYTVHNNVLCTIGRVQTPTLAMIVKRDAVIADFKKAYFYELVAGFEEGFTAKYTINGQNRIEVKEEVERLHRQLSPNTIGKVLKVDKKIKKHRPPSLYDLNNLQREANRRFGFTAAQVLEYAQALYETHKVITYPRTESRHISEDMVPELPGILHKLDHSQAPAALERLRGGHKLGKAYVDRTKLTDHHAIIPTGQRPTSNLPPALKKVYDLVVARFVGVFLPDQTVQETTVTVDIGGAIFVAKGSVVLEEGWKVVETRRGGEGKGKGDKEGEDEDQRQTIPPLERGQEVHIKNMDVVEKETKPPRPYTDATLLAAMKNAGREIEDDELASAMKESGLGTPATRAETIEKLIRTGYVAREKKSLGATEKAKALIGVVAEPMRSPELTAEWEQQLKEVEDGQRPVAEFYDGIANFVRGLVPEIEQGPALSPEQAAQARAEHGGGRKGGKKRPGKEIGVCPKCKEGKVGENAKAYGCSRYREGCDFTIWKTVAKKKLTEKQAQFLMANGRTDKMKGFTSKAGKKFEARLKFDDNFKVVFEFDDGPRNGAAMPQPRSVPARPLREGRAPAARQSSPPYAGDQGPLPEEGMPYPEEQGPPVYGDDPGPVPSQTLVRKRSSHAQSPASMQPSPPAQSTPETSCDLACPKCNQGLIIEGKRGFGCNRYREGCDFVVWKEMASKKLTQKQIQTLIAKGKTGLIKGFKSRKGGKFDARLKLDEGWKAVFDFAD